MESITSDIWGSIFNAIDFVYIVMCNVVTYIIINIWESYSELATWKKKSISAITAIILGIVVIKVFNHDKEAVFYGFFLQFFVYDYFWRWLIKWIEKNISKIDQK